MPEQLTIKLNVKCIVSQTEKLVNRKLIKNMVKKLEITYKISKIIIDESSYL